jgi:hypothetical protein
MHEAPYHTPAFPRKVSEGQLRAALLALAEHGSVLLDRHEHATQVLRAAVETAPHGAGLFRIRPSGAGWAVESHARR